MPIPTSMADLNVSAASNSPAGTDPIGNTLDDFLRTIQAIVRREQAQGASIASATTTNIASNTDGNYVHITGTTTITGFGTVAAGVSRTVVFDSSLVLTHNSSSLILPGGVNITTVPGDVAEFISEGSGNWRCVKYVAAPPNLLSKSVAGNTDVTLSVTEYGSKIIILTGVLTGNINVIFPLVTKEWLVINNTSGSFTITCKTSGGTGTLVAQSGVQYIWGDGTNINQGPGDTRYDSRYASSGSVHSEQYVYIRDEKSSGTDGGSFTQGAWRTRTLNTKVRDTGNNAALTMNQITLQPGTYRFSATAPTVVVGRNRLRLQNVTDGTTVATGKSAFNGVYSGTTDTSTGEASVRGAFTISSTKAFELQHFGEGTQNTNGFGFAGGSAAGSVNEVYGEIEFWKEY